MKDEGAIRACAGLLVIATLWIPPAPAAAKDEDAERIRRLEREVEDLKLLVSDLVEAGRHEPAGRALESGEPESTGSTFHVPDAALRGFGHLQYDLARIDPTGLDADTERSFVLGGVDLFITAKLAEQLSFFNETVFEFGEEGENILDVERVLLKWEPRDWFRVAGGRGHTALGYWNHRFHHGVYLQTTAERPLLYGFEDDGGILPVHFVGVELSGDLISDDGVLSYYVNVANGRGRIVDSIQLIEDRNNQSALAAMLTFEPAWFPGFGIGINGLLDEIPPDPDVVGRERSIDETLAGAHLFYTQDPWEFLLEGQWIGHEDGATDRLLSSWGGYAQLAYARGHWKPYYRFDLLEIHRDDAFFAGLPGVEDTYQHTLGVRVDPIPWASIKLEFRRRDSDSFDSNEGTVQTSFAF